MDTNEEEAGEMEEQLCRREEYGRAKTNDLNYLNGAVPNESRNLIVFHNQD